MSDNHILNFLLRLTFVVFLLPLKVGSELLNTKIHQIFSYENPEIYMYEDVD